MSESSPSPTTARGLKPSSKRFFERFSSLIQREPEDREALRSMLLSAHARELLDADSLSMIEGVLEMSERTAGEIMVPRARMEVVDLDGGIEQVMACVVRTGHSRFPVIQHSRDNVLGILLAKDLLHCVVGTQVPLSALLRPAVFIPESKRLDVLLREFRSHRNHLALVVDEHGGTAGLITIEDVIEVIVGEIEDEFDHSTLEQLIFTDGHQRWRVQAQAEIGAFNEAFGTDFDDSAYDTMSGWLAGQLGRIPKRGDRLEAAGLAIEVIRADARRAQWLRVARLAETAGDGVNA